MNYKFNGKNDTTQVLGVDLQNLLKPSSPACYGLIVEISLLHTFMVEV